MRRRRAVGGGVGVGAVRVETGRGVVSPGDHDWGKTEQRENNSAISREEEVGQHRMF